MNPHSRRIGVKIGVVVIAAWAFGARAADPLPDRRAVNHPVVVTPVSNQAPGSVTVRDNSMLDVYQQLDDMRNQIEQLQNQVEVQAHQIEQLKSQQRATANDLDRRVQTLENRKTEPVTPITTVPPASASNGGKTLSAQEQQEYDAAFNLMKQSQYDHAIKSFREFLVAHPKSNLADNAQFWIAEGNYVQGNYKIALDEFARVTTAYPDSGKVPDSLLKIGYIQYELNSMDKARKTLQDLVRRYPNSNAAQLAQKRLDKMRKARH